jgi:hypothetical protein
MPSSYTKLINFLNSYRVDKSKDPTYTHTSMGKPAGSYYIPSDPMIKRQLTQLMYAAIFNIHIIQSITTLTLVSMVLLI